MNASPLAARSHLQKRVRDGINRLQDTWFYILQVGLAAGASFWVGQALIGHAQPFFAPMSTVIVLSTTGGQRHRHAMELIAGVALGVGLGDLLIGTFGTGIWQIAVGVAAAVALGTFVDRGVLVANQAAFAAILVATLLPPETSGATDRMTDALIGGLVGMLAMAILPESPLKKGRREVSRLMLVTSQVLHEVAMALPTHDQDRIKQALQNARGTQATINAMIAAAHQGKENLNVSPLMWRQKYKIRSLLRILNPVDNALRNTRVLARRSLVLAEDHDEVSATQIHIIEELADISYQLHGIFAGKGSETNEATADVIRRLRMLGVQAGLEAAAGNVLSAQVILGQSRSIIVDMLQICGWSRRSAIAALCPTSTHPGQVPELWEKPQDPA